jgi:type I restriction enzyme R subunit
VLDWRKKQSTRAPLMESIKDALGAGLPCAYTPELYRQKCAAVFEHVYESYPERGAGCGAGRLAETAPKALWRCDIKTS